MARPIAEPNTAIATTAAVRPTFIGPARARGWLFGESGGEDGMQAWAWPRRCLLPGACLRWSARTRGWLFGESGGEDGMNAAASPRRCLLPGACLRWSARTRG